MPAMVAMRHNPAVAVLAARLRVQGRLKPKQILIAAMPKLLVIYCGVRKTGRSCDAALGMPSVLYQPPLTLTFVIAVEVR